MFRLLKLLWVALGKVEKILIYLAKRRWRAPVTKNAINPIRGQVIQISMFTKAFSLLFQHFSQGIGSRRVGVKNDTDLLNSDTEDSDLEVEDPRLEEGSSDSDVTIDEWQNESRAWQVGPGNNNRSTARNEPLIKPIPANISEDDF